MAIAPYAKGEKAPELDVKDALNAGIVLKLNAQCLVGHMFREIKCREGLSEDEIEQRGQRVMDDLIAALDKAKAEIPNRVAVAMSAE
jgi:hypothetical protein